jgi:hypothetical protein
MVKIKKLCLREFCVVLSCIHQLIHPRLEKKQAILEHSPAHGDSIRIQT